MKQSPIILFIRQVSVGSQKDQKQEDGKLYSEGDLWRPGVGVGGREREYTHADRSLNLKGSSIPSKAFAKDPLVPGAVRSLSLKWPLGWPKHLEQLGASGFFNMWLKCEWNLVFQIKRGPLLTYQHRGGGNVSLCRIELLALVCLSVCLSHCKYRNGRQISASPEMQTTLPFLCVPNWLASMFPFCVKELKCQQSS